MQGIKQRPRQSIGESDKRAKKEGSKVGRSNNSFNGFRPLNEKNPNSKADGSKTSRTHKAAGKEKATPSYPSYPIVKTAFSIVSFSNKEKFFLSLDAFISQVESNKSLLSHRDMEDFAIICKTLLKNLGEKDEETEESSPQNLNHLTRIKQHALSLLKHFKERLLKDLKERRIASLKDYPSLAILYSMDEAELAREFIGLDVKGEN